MTRKKAEVASQHTVTERHISIKVPGVILLLLFFVLGFATGWLVHSPAKAPQSVQQPNAAPPPPPTSWLGGVVALAATSQTSDQDILKKILADKTEQPFTMGNFSYHCAQISLADYRCAILGNAGPPIPGVTYPLLIGFEGAPVFTNGTSTVGPLTNDPGLTENGLAKGYWWECSHIFCVEVAKPGDKPPPDAQAIVPVAASWNCGGYIYNNPWMFIKFTVPDVTGFVALKNVRFYVATGDPKNPWEKTALPLQGITCSKSS